MAPIYIFSGLGTDERVFRNIDFSGYEHTFIRWIPPLHREKIEDYCGRLRQQITATRTVLIGLSFGGMMAMEMAKQIETEKIILLATAKTRGELPWYFRLAGKAGLYNIIPVSLLRRPTLAGNWLFGVRTREEKELLAEIVRDTDPVFLKWAIKEILCWKNTAIYGNPTHIHGAADRLLPMAFVKADVVVPHGGHFMTVNRSGEITGIIRELLGQRGNLTNE